MAPDGSVNQVRTLVVAAVAVVVAAFTGACSVDSNGPDNRDSSGITEDATTPDPETSATPSPLSPDDEVVDSAACEEVRAGIDAFNAGDYAETVKRFEAARPLAVAQDDGSKAASQLIEAVGFYAELAPGLYPDAARTSPLFAKYKAITLGQCVPVDGGTSESPGTDI